jgi:hypothetical protein
MSHFNESLYLRKQIQKLHEENMKLKKYLYEMQLQQDAGSLMVPELSTSPDTYLPAKTNDVTVIMQDRTPPAPSEDDLKILKSLSAAQISQKLRELLDKGERGKAQIWVEWLRKNRKDVYDLLDRDLRDLSPDPVQP